MFGTLGGPELVLILVLALIVFGPRKLPDIGRSMGKMLAEFRSASNEFKRTIEDEVDAEKLKAKKAAVARQEAAASAAAPAEGPKEEGTATSPADPPLSAEAAPSLADAPTGPVLVQAPGSISRGDETDVPPWQKPAATEPE